MHFPYNTTIHFYCNAATCFGQPTGPSLGWGGGVLKRVNMHAKYTLHFLDFKLSPCTEYSKFPLG